MNAATASLYSIGHVFSCGVTLHETNVETSHDRELQDERCDQLSRPSGLSLIVSCSLWFSLHF